MAECLLSFLDKSSKKDELPTLVLWLWVQCLEIFSRKVMAFDENSPFSEFEHILIQDGSSQAVYDALKEVFPGRFSTVSPAAVELHTTMDILTNNLVRVQLTEDTRPGRDCLPPLPTSMAYSLMLMDAGYCELELFAAIDDREGFYLQGTSEHQPDDTLRGTGGWQESQSLQRPKTEGCDVWLP